MVTKKWIGSSILACDHQQKRSCLCAAKFPTGSSKIYCRSQQKSSRRRLVPALVEGGCSFSVRWFQEKIYPDCSIGSRRLRRRQLLVCSNHSSWFQHRRTPVPATPDSAPGTAVRPWLQLPPGSGCSFAPQASTLAVAASCSFSAVDMPGSCTACRRWQLCALRLAALTPRPSGGRR